MVRLSQSDCQAALRILEKLSANEELKNHLNNVISILKSKNFEALLDIQEYYEHILTEAHKSVDTVRHEAQLLAKKWHNDEYIAGERDN